MPLQPEDVAKLEISRYERWHEVANQRLAYVSNLSALVHKQLLVLNGGGIIAMFTLLGHSDLIRVAGSNVWAAFACFGLSFFCLFISIACSFFAQNDFMLSEWRLSENLYMELATEKLPEGWKKHDTTGLISRGSVIRNGAIATALLAAAFFVAAGGCALFGVQVRGTVEMPASCASMGAIKAVASVRTR